MSTPQNLFRTKRAPSLKRAAQIKAWASRYFELPQSAIVLVSERRCVEPGCPPLETVIALFDGDGSSTQRTLPKALAEVTEPDVRALAGSSHAAAPMKSG